MKRKTTRYPEGRSHLSLRRSPGGSLPHGLLKFSSILAVQLIMPAFTVSCNMLEELFGELETEKSAVSFYRSGDSRIDLAEDMLAMKSLNYVLSFQESFGKNLLSRTIEWF